MSNQVGGALLRVIGAAQTAEGESSPASMSDALEVIDAVMGSSEFRSRATALASLSADIPVDRRKETCRALLILMNNRRAPAEEAADKESFRVTTQEYCALAAPLPHTAWSAHVETTYKKSGAPEFVRVSPYFAEMISTFEALFGLRGALLVP